MASTLQYAKEKKGGDISRKTQSDRVLRHRRHDNNLNRAHTITMLHGDTLDSGQEH